MAGGILKRGKIKVFGGTAEMVLEQQGNLYRVVAEGEVVFSNHKRSEAERVFNTKNVRTDAADADPATRSKATKKGDRWIGEVWIGSELWMKSDPGSFGSETEAIAWAKSWAPKAKKDWKEANRKDSTVKASIEDALRVADDLYRRADAAVARVDETEEQYIRRTGSNSGYGQTYDPASVNKAIANNRTGKIGGRESKMIHALLRGRG